MQILDIDTFANIIDKLALKALLLEVSTTPKPGLVDIENNGAHRDMDYQTFLKSIESLKGYFYKVTTAGCYESDLSSLLLKIRPIGKEAEKKMFLSTNGINTHKGIIFSLGILCSVTGYYYINNHTIDINQILDLTKVMTNDVIENDFKIIDKDNPKTHGEKLYVMYGNKGIRGEVQNGFPSIRNLYNIDNYNNWNDINIEILFNLMQKVNDTNVLIRSGENGLNLMHEKAQSINYHNKEEIEKLNDLFIEHNISPGGCADLLAIIIFLILLKGWYTYE